MCAKPDGYHAGDAPHDHAHPHPPIARPRTGLQLHTWGHLYSHDPQLALTLLEVDTALLPVPMAHSVASGKGLVSNGHLGVDLIRLAAGDGFVPHTHPGDHLLICVGGRGTITFDGVVHETRAGQVYMVEGAVPHAVGAITDHVILAVGAPHKPVDSPERMSPVEYQHILAGSEDMYCRICDRGATYPTMLHDAGCSHCPCPYCVSTGDDAEDARLRAAYDRLLAGAR